MGDISALKPKLERLKNALFLALESVRNEMRHQKKRKKESEDYDDVRHLSLKKSVCDKSSLGAEKRAFSGWKNHAAPSRSTDHTLVEFSILLIVVVVNNSLDFLNVVQVFMMDIFLRFQNTESWENI